MSEQVEPNLVTKGFLELLQRLCLVFLQVYICIISITNMWFFCTKANTLYLGLSTLVYRVPRVPDILGPYF